MTTPNQTQRPTGGKAAGPGACDTPGAGATTQLWTAERFRRSAGRWMPILQAPQPMEQIREGLLDDVNRLHFSTYSGEGPLHDLDRVIVRDCARAWRGLLHPRSEHLAGGSVLERLIAAARGHSDTDLKPAFWAEIVHLVEGIQGSVRLHEGDVLSAGLEGHSAAIQRSDELDLLSQRVDEGMSRWTSGLEPAAISRRRRRAAAVRATFGIGMPEWGRWEWQVRNACRTAEALAALANLSGVEKDSIHAATRMGYPFAVTPYYASLFDMTPNSGRDLAIRAQVIPPSSLVEALAGATTDRHGSDYMLESDTSPIPLVTRRYPSIVILKPLSACPQVCVYCQRNWELDQAEATDKGCNSAPLDAALNWIREHTGIHEVLVTGGDPLMLSDNALKRILDALAGMSHIERIRVGTRTPVTMPMRVTQRLCRLLASYQCPGVREVCLMTHVEHPSEVTPEFRAAMHRVRKAGIRVYNQMVYTFFVSRRFEAAALRRQLRLCGVDPYYTFYPKAKGETEEYRVPIARLLQEQKEESRLTPGLTRTDEAVFNVPGLGKNPLNSWQHRDLISITPKGARVYEFHPWEKKVSPQRTFVAHDVPILDYLSRLQRLGEDVRDYESIWYYF